MRVESLTLRLSRLGGVAAAVLGLLAAGCASTAEGGDGGVGANGSGVIVSTPKDDSGYHGVEDRTYDLPDITLTAASGRPFNLARDTNKPVTMVFFGYTHCPDICPTTVANVTQALRQAPEGVRQRVQFLFVTSDPARDTPARLSAWLGRFDDSHVGLTGDLDKIEQVAKKLGIPLGGKDRLPSGGYLVGHGSQVLAFGPDDRSRLLWTRSTTVGEYHDDIVTLAKNF